MILVGNLPNPLSVAIMISTIKNPTFNSSLLTYDNDNDNILFDHILLVNNIIYSLWDKQITNSSEDYY